MANIFISDIEAAINYWRLKEPTLCASALGVNTSALAEIYALMALEKIDAVAATQLSPQAWRAWLAWYESTVDTPCIAICSTSQGDALCKGCGRTLEEIQHWLSMDPVAKRAVWQRITQQASAWRFNRYAERATEVDDAAVVAAK